MKGDGGTPARSCSTHSPSIPPSPHQGSRMGPSVPPVSRAPPSFSPGVPRSEGPHSSPGVRRSSGACSEGGGVLAGQVRGAGTQEALRPCQTMTRWVGDEDQDHRDLLLSMKGDLWAPRLRASLVEQSHCTTTALSASPVTGVKVTGSDRCKVTERGTDAGSRTLHCRPGTPQLLCALAAPRFGRGGRLCFCWAVLQTPPASGSEQSRQSHRQ